MPILKTAKVELEPAWAALLEPVTDRAIRNGLSRFARWASLRRVLPAAVETATIERFVNELAAGGLGPESIKHIRACLRVALAQAQREGLIPMKKPVATCSGDPSSSAYRWVRRESLRGIGSPSAACVTPGTARTCAATRLKNASRSSIGLSAR